MGTQKGSNVGGASLRPSDAVEGGGLLDNVDVTWTKCLFEMWDYNGTQPASPAFKVEMEMEDGDKAGQYFSCGKAEDWSPSQNGSKLIPIGGAQKLNKASNFMILLDSLVKADFPEDKIGEEATVFEGLECHMVRVPAPKRPGLAPAKPRADGRTYERTNFVVDVIHKLPWDKGAGSSGKGTESEDLKSKTTAAILEILGSNPKGFQKQKLAGLVFTNLNASKDKDANAAAQLALKENFIKEGPWNYDKGIVSLSQ
jgi:hypothetical protein